MGNFVTARILETDDNLSILRTTSPAVPVAVIERNRTGGFEDMFEADFRRALPPGKRISVELRNVRGKLRPVGVRELRRKQQQSSNH